MQEQAPTQPPKKEKKPKATFAVKPEHFENRNGLRKLYELTNEVNWKENIPVEAAMNLVTVTLKTWHYQLMPKYSFDYFLQRCQALGNHKLVSAYMSRVRRIHRGVEFWPETQPTNTNKQQKQEFTQRVEMVQEQASVHHNKPQTDKIEQEDAYDEELKLFEQMSQKRKMKKEQPEEKGVDLEPCDIDIDYDYE